MIVQGKPGVRRKASRSNPSKTTIVPFTKKRNLTALGRYMGKCSTENVYVDQIPGRNLTSKADVECRSIKHDP